MIPLGEAPDEADHYAYAAYIGREGRLPEGAALTQAKHPPLYHALAAAAAWWTGMDFGFLRSNPDGGAAAGQEPDPAPNFFVHTTLEAWPWRDGSLAMHLGRAVSVLAGLVLVLATYGLGRAIWPEWPAGAVAGAALAAFIPESLFIGGAMSNDLLAAAFAALALWAGFRRGGGRYGNALLCGAFCGLAFLTKVSAVAVAPVAFAGLWLGQCNLQAGDLTNRPARGGAAGTSAGHARRLGPVVAAGTVAILIAAPWLWRNWRLYGDALGMPVVLGTIDRRAGPLGLADLWWLARGWFFSFWGKFGGAGQLALPGWMYALWGGLIVVGAGGWVRESVWTAKGAEPYAYGGGRRRESRERVVSQAGLAGKSEGSQARAARWPVLLGAPALVVLSMISYSQVALGTDQGRLLFPALAPIALLIGGGIAAWWPQRHTTFASAAWTAGLTAVAAIALVAGIVQPFAPPRPASPTASITMHQANIAFGSEIRLVSWTMDDRMTRLTLYWQAQGPTRDDLRTRVRLMDPEGNVLWEWKRSPGEGRYSTDRWPAGQVVEDTYVLPRDKTGWPARLDLGVYVFPDADRLLPAGGEAGGWFTLWAAGPAGGQ